MGLRTSVRKFLMNSKYPMANYEPKNKKSPQKLLDIPSAWKGLEQIVGDILDQFDIGRDNCIEFGTEYGYSTVVFAQYFKRVKGIDIFIGDEHSGHKGCHYEQTKESIAEFQNIELIKSDYREWIAVDSANYNLAHVDIIHTYKETFECGLWAAQHSDCCLFHDTDAFKEVRRAVFDVAKATGKKVYNYPFHHGLGIIV